MAEMIQRRTEDVLRSLKRYAAQMLGDDWEVRLGSGDEGTFRRPFAAVGLATTVTYQPSSQFIAEVLGPFFIHAYPAQGATPDESMLLALRAEELIYQGLSVGVDTGHPMRLPLFDYEGVETADGTSMRNPPDYARVQDLSTQLVRDADDARLWVVVADVRLGWRRRAAVLSGGRLVESVKLEAAD